MEFQDLEQPVIDIDSFKKWVLSMTSPREDYIEIHERE